MSIGLQPAALELLRQRKVLTAILGPDRDNHRFEDPFLLQRFLPIFCLNQALRAHSQRHKELLHDFYLHYHPFFLLRVPHPAKHLQFDLLRRLPDILQIERR